MERRGNKGIEKYRKSLGAAIYFKLNKTTGDKALVRKERLELSRLAALEPKSMPS